MLIRSARSVLVGVALAALLAACQSGPAKVRSDRPTGSPSPAQSVVSGSSPTPEATSRPSPPVPWVTSGAPTSTCEHGWNRPERGTSRYEYPIKLIRRMTDLLGTVVVMDLRYFEGPESPPTDKPYLNDIQRWYVKLYSKSDPSYRARFLVEARRFGSGLVAVAPFDTKGFRSPDWHGFEYNSGDLTPRVYPGLPGAWTGIAYDFVKGGAGMTFPGLPREVVGCLSGT